MPLPARLKYRIEFTSDLLRDVKNELIKRGTVCEIPDCSGQAVYPYRNERSVLFVCEDDKARIESAPSNSMTSVNKRLSESMYQGLLNKSFVYMNNKSGFKLEDLVADFNRQVADIAKKEKQTASKQRTEIRRLQEESKTRIGAPDDALITSRQRNDLKKMNGQPTKGPARKVPTVNAVPTAHLVNHLPLTLPMVDPAAEASLPFPFTNLM